MDVKDIHTSEELAEFLSRNKNKTFSPKARDFLAHRGLSID